MLTGKPQMLCVNLVYFGQNEIIVRNNSVLIDKAFSKHYILN